MLVAITVSLAAVAVLAAIVVVAVGRGGELSAAHPDHPPSPLPMNRDVVGTDAALLRLPLGLFGYQKQITDQCLERLASALTERDTRIAVLAAELAETRQMLAAEQRQPELAWPVPEPKPATETAAESEQPRDTEPEKVQEESE